MTSQQATAVAAAAARSDLLESLLQIGIDLSVTRDRRQMWDTILSEARRLSGAEAASLYIRRGEHLEFTVAQNDAADTAGVSAALLGRKIEVGSDSLAGFVASTGEALNVADSYRLDPDAPFRIHREVDAATGYRTKSVLAIPLTCPDGAVVGVIELINRVGDGGRIVAFDDSDGSPIASLASMAAVSVHNLLLAEQLKQAHLDSVIRLAVVAEFRDRNTAEHIQRISRLSALTADAMGLADEQVELIRCASPMHDIGKVGIPDSILLKPVALTPDERRIVETHALIGAEILGNPTNELVAAARQIALHHHERWDGDGYPHRLKHAEIPLMARIVCLADVFDALATKRCYKEAFPIDEVIRIVEAEKAKHFDPAVVEAFFTVIDEATAAYPCA